MAEKGDRGHPRMSAAFPGSSEHLEEMASAAGEKAEELKGKAKQFAARVADQAQQTWQGAQRGIKEAFVTMSERCGELCQDATRMVKRHPIAAMAVAFGLGCCLSTFIQLRRHSDDMTQRMSRASS